MIFMGTPDFSVPILEALIHTYDVVLVVTQPDRPKGRKKTLTPPPVKTKALEYGIQVFQPEKIKDEMNELFKYEADIIVTAAFGQLLPKAILDYPAFGCINVHASLLPELRGGAPIHYAILEGKKETGVTIMYMVEKLDAGDMIRQAKVQIEEMDNVGILHDKLSDVGCKLLLETLPDIFKGQINPLPQDEAKATFAPNISRETERIDWRESDENIFNKVRGLFPWPTAYTEHEGKRLKVLASEKTNQQMTDKSAGEIVAVSETGIDVVSGNHKVIRILTLQVAGKKRMDVKEFIQGNPDVFTIGQILGDKS